MSGSTVDQVKLLLDSLRIYSPTKKEAAYASFLADKMELMGYKKVRVDRAGNVLGEVGKGSIRLLLCGHMDTVPGELPVKMASDSIYGRGAADAKAPLCALLSAGAAAADSGLNVVFAGVTEEEGDGTGIESLIRNSRRFDYAIFGEPGGAGRITIAYRGRVALRMTIKTEGGHAGSPWAYRSAFSEFIATLEKLSEYERSMEVPGNRFRSLSITPTLVRAGSYQNVIPNICQATIDMRLPPSLSSSEVVSEVRSIGERAGDGLSIEIEAGEPTEAYEVEGGSSLLRALQRAIILRLKIRPGLIRKTSTGDMNSFARRKRTESVTYGPGVSPSSHTDGEAVQVADYLNSIEVLKEAFQQLVTLSKRNDA